MQPATMALKVFPDEGFFGVLGVAMCCATRGVHLGRRILVGCSVGFERTFLGRRPGIHNVHSRRLVVWERKGILSDALEHMVQAIEVFGQNDRQGVGRKRCSSRSCSRPSPEKSGPIPLSGGASRPQPTCARPCMFRRKTPRWTLRDASPHPALAFWLAGAGGLGNRIPSHFHGATSLPSVGVRFVASPMGVEHPFTRRAPDGCLCPIPRVPCILCAA